MTLWTKWVGIHQHRHPSASERCARAVPVLSSETVSQPSGESLSRQDDCGNDSGWLLQSGTHVLRKRPDELFRMRKTELTMPHPLAQKRPAALHPCSSRITGLLICPNVMNLIGSPRLAPCLSLFREPTHRTSDPCRERIPQ